MSLLTGGIPTATELAPLSALGSHWTSYTPAWTGDTTNPNLGNGTITARYAQIGKLVCYAGVITMGSTTTFGAGNWRISLPVAAQNAAAIVGSAEFIDANGSDHSGVCFGSGSTLLFTPGTGEMSPTNPQTWAVSDSFKWSIVYEAA